MRSNGSYLGATPTGPSTAVASGIWGLRDADRYDRDGQWPAAPGAPTGLAADSTGDGTIDLSWTAPAVGNITDYIVEYTPSGGSAATVSVGGATTSYQITGLTNGTEYSVRVAASNAGLVGAYSTAVTGTPSASSDWDLSSFSYAQSLSVASQDSIPTNLFFRADGLKLFVSGNNADSIFGYDLSTAWDVSTASYAQQVSVSSQDTIVTGVWFKPDGLIMYVAGNGNDSVYEYSLSSAWDLTTASYVRTLSVSSYETNLAGVTLKPDGSKLFVSGGSSDSTHEYDLSTPWDISTASYVAGFSFSAQDIAIYGHHFSNDGSQLFVVGTVGDNVYKYTLSVPWSVSTATYSQSFSVAAQESSPFGVFFHVDGLKMFVVGPVSDSVHEYAIP